MSKMIIMRGLPASGKSTKAEQLAKEHGAVRINKDLLRTMLHFDRFTGKNEDKTRRAARLLAAYFLDETNVIIDDTNLNPKTVQSFVDLAKEKNAKIEYVDMDTSVEDCIARDALRQKKVGKHVILKMALQWQKYGADVPTVICDLDGTLCDIDHRLHHVKGEKKDWKAFFAEIPGDKVRKEIFLKVMMHEALGRQIIFVSARPEDHRETTENWLDEVFNSQRPHLTLLMRESGDKRPDTEVKKEIYDRYLKHLTITKVYDDRPSVIRMWRELGLDVEDCGTGVEF